MQTIDRMMQIIHFFIKNNINIEYSISEISKGVDLPLSSTHRILNALLKYRLVVQDERNKMYKLGPLWMEYGLKMYDTVDYMGIVRPELERFSFQVKKTVYLWKRLDKEAILMERLDHQEDSFMYKESLGTVMEIPDGELGELFLMPDQPNEELSADQKTAMEQVKKMGYLTKTSKLNDSILIVATPVYNSKQIVDSVVCTYLDTSIDEDELNKVVNWLLLTGQHVSKRLT